MPTILLVEDNEMNRDMMSRWLARWGYDVIFAFDGEEAIKKGHSGKPDLILMDLGLPVIDGFEATRRLKAETSTRQIPIIAVTGFAAEDDREKALSAKCDDYIAKPVDFEHLRNRIDELLSRRLLHGEP